MALSRYVKTGIEATFGGGAAAATTGVICTSVTDPIDRGVMVEESIDSYVARAAYGGPLKLGGTIEGNLRPQQMTDWFECVMGTMTDLAPNQDYTLSDSKSFELEIADDTTGADMAMKYVGSAWKSISIKAEAKEFVKFSGDWFAQDVSKVTYTEPSYSAEDPIIFYNAALTIGGAASIESTDVDLKINRNLKEDNFVLNDFKVHNLSSAGHTEIGGTLGFTELEYDELLAAAFGAPANTTIPATNDVENVALLLNMYDMANDLRFTASAPVSVYTGSGRNITGRDNITKSVDYKVIGDAFKFTYTE